jgi:alpha-galactosidase
MDDKAIYNTEIVRNEMFLHLDYYVTESIEKYCTHGTGWNPGAHRFILEEYLTRENTWLDEINDYLNSDDIDLKRGQEYAAYIFNAVFGDNTLFEFNGNMRNHGIIDNLPHGCCVEVPVVASKAGFRTVKVGNLPPALALMNNITAGCEELAVEGSLTGDPRKIYEAVCFDPLTSAVLSLEEIKQMTNEMFEKNKNYLPQFKNFKI